MTKPTHFNRRKHFLVQKSMQFRYMLYVIALLTIVSGVGIVGTYYGIWASVVEAFSADTIQNTMQTAAQIHEYDLARRPNALYENNSSLRQFRETDLLSTHQKETIQKILELTNRRLIGLGIILIILIGWASVYVTHKIAGPLFRLDRCFESIRNGDLRVRANLRKLDEAKNIAKSFNEMIFTLDKKIARLKQIVSRSSRENAFEEIKRELANFKNSSDGH